MTTFIDNGGKIWLCPACVKAKGIIESDLIEGVEIAGAPKTTAYLASGAKLFA
ncbi:MAG: DsrE family protein [Gammaproteobacteria bacterium]|nr:DsrE family protein [Gammaproteobacteria bacterium]